MRDPVRLASPCSSARGGVAAWLDSVRLDHAGLRRRRPPVLRGPAPGRDPPPVAARPGALAPRDRLDLARARPGCRPWLNRHGGPGSRSSRVGYAIRAVIWICGGNLPLVPGDSCHYLEVATSVLRGEGPVKHYVESFFMDYPPHPRRRGRPRRLGHAARRLRARVGLPDRGPRAAIPLEARIAAAKACSFILNLLCLPALYVFARRRYGCRVALGAMAVLAVLPVHAIYAGFILRESLVALTVDPGGLDADRGLARRIRAQRRSGPGPSRRALRRAGRDSRARPDWRCWRPRVSSPSSLTAGGGWLPLLLWGAIVVAGVRALGVGDVAGIWNAVLFDTQLF